MLQKLLAPLRNYPKDVTRLVIRGIFFGVWGYRTAFLFKNIIDSLTHTKDSRTIWHAFIVIVLLFLFNNLFRPFFRQLRQQLSNKIQGDLYTRYITSYLNGDPQATEQLGTGKTNSILQKGCDNRVPLLEFFMQDFRELAISLIIGVITLGLPFGVTGIIVALLMTFFVIILSKKGSDKVNIFRKQKRDVYNEGDRNIVRIIMSKYEILQQSTVYKEVSNLYTNVFKQIHILLSKENHGMILLFDSSHTMLTIVRILLLAYCIILVDTGTMSIGTLTLLRMSGGAMSSAIHAIVDRIPKLTQQFIFVQKLRDTFDAMPPLAGYNTGDTFVFSAGAIDINQISFHYNTTTKDQQSNAPIFTNFSLAIPAGKKIALVGPSGAGKSTLVKLIAGYLQPQSGSICVDGQDLKTIALQSYYPYIGYLTQDSSVFDGTIRENLEYGIHLPSPSDDEGGAVRTMVPVTGRGVGGEVISEILSLAKCEFIFDLPAGIDTEIGERGIRLSGGQRQRLAIAKIMLKDPKIIILDEPTSALDSIAEQEVTEAMNNLFIGRTVIIIAHRLQTVKQADEIIVLGSTGGTAHILEHGTHQQLIAAQGAYATMVELQSGF